MENWSVDQVCNWLRQRNLGELVPKFRAAEEEISGAALLALNDRMVQQLVKKIGHQAVLMDLINKYQQQKSVLESLTYCCETAYPKFPEVISGDTDRKMLNYSGPVEQKKCLCSNENEEGPFDPRVHKRKKNLKSVMARYKMLQWSSSYALPDFPYDIKCILAEKKCPDHSMRIRIIEFLQADMTKYLEGSLYPNSQQYNTAVSTLLQAYPFLNEDGNSFLLWKRALKDRFKYVRRPIEDDEQVLRNKWKFGHRRGQTRKSSFAENKTDDVQMQGKEAITSLITLSNSSLEKTVACRDKLPVMFWDILRARDDDCCSACPSPVTCQQFSRTELTTWKLHQLKQYLLDKGDGDNKEELVHLEGSAMDVPIKWLKQKYMKTQEELERAFQGVLVSHTDGHL